MIRDDTNPRPPIPGAAVRIFGSARESVKVLNWRGSLKPGASGLQDGFAPAAGSGCGCGVGHANSASQAGSSRLFPLPLDRPSMWCAPAWHTETGALLCGHRMEDPDVRFDVHTVSTLSVDLHWRKVIR